MSEESAAFDLFPRQNESSASSSSGDFKVEEAINLWRSIPSSGGSGAGGRQVMAVDWGVGSKFSFHVAFAERC